MKRINNYLGVALVAQIAVVISIQAFQGDEGVSELKEYFVGFDAAKVTRLEIHGASEEDVVANGTTSQDGNDKPSSIELKKQEDLWVVASHFDYPVDRAKIDDFLSKLASVRTRGPVTTSTSRHAQLKVSDTSYERKLVMHGSEPSDERVMFLGSSPGFRKVHVRLRDSEQTHAVSGISAWDVGQNVTDWIDATYFEVKDSEVTSVIVENKNGVFEFGRTDDKEWRLLRPEITPPSGKEFDTDAIKNMIRDVATIRLQKPVGTEASAELGFDNRLARIQIRTEKMPPPPSEPSAAGDAGVSEPVSVMPEKAEYDILVGKEMDDEYTVKASGTSYVVSVSTSSLRKWVELAKGDLYKDPNTKDAPGADVGGIGAGGFGQGVPPFPQR